jgi:hypothetical protein
MADRTKLLVHFRRLSGILESAILNGPDGTFEGKFAAEHPVFVHHACSFYLIGCLAYLEGEDGAYSWNLPSAGHSDFDTFADAYPPSPKASFLSQGISKVSLRALADIRNAVAHHAGNISQLRRAKSIDIVGQVTAANLPGVSMSGSVVTLEAPFLEYVRIAALSVRIYHGEF